MKTHDVSEQPFGECVSNFSAQVFFELLEKLGAECEALALMFVHPVVLARIFTHNMVDFIPAEPGDPSYRKEDLDWTTRPSDVITFLGIDVRIAERELERGDNVYVTRVVARDGRVGDLITREG